MRRANGSRTDRGAGTPLVLTAGADHRLTVLDPRRSLQAVHVFEEHRDHVYSLTAIGVC